MNLFRYVWLLVSRTTHSVRALAAAQREGVPDIAGGVYDEIPRQWARDLLRATGITVRTLGAERLQSIGPCVYASNHVSFVDTWALVVALPGSVRFLAKRELLRIPIFGAGIRLSGQIPIDRARRDEAIGAVDEAALAIRAGKSAIVFVEGTRSRDGSLRPFKKGAFVLAIEAQVPLVPVFVSGAFERLPRGHIVPTPGEITVRIGPPISTAGLTYDDRDALLAETRVAMEAMKREA